MKPVVVVFRPRIGDGRRRRAAGDAGWLAMKPVRDKPAQEPDPAYRHIPFNLMTSIWYGATVGCIGAAVMPPFSEGGRLGNPA